MCVICSGYLGATHEAYHQNPTLFQVFQAVEVNRLRLDQYVLLEEEQRIRRSGWLKRETLMFVRLKYNPLPHLKTGAENGRQELKAEGNLHCQSPVQSQVMAVTTVGSKLHHLRLTL